MKAKDIDGIITAYNILPSDYKKSNGSVILNFRYANKETLEAEGFYDITTPSFDASIEQLGDLKWDSKNKVFTYEKSDINFPLSLAEMKAEKKDALKKLANKDLSLTDWYVTRKADIGTAIPDDINTQRKEIRDKVAERETEIDALNTKKKVAQWNVILFDIPEFPIV